MHLFLRFAVVVLVACNWIYLVVARPSFNEEYALERSVFIPQVIVMVTALVMLAVLVVLERKPHKYLILTIGLLIDVICGGIFSLCYVPIPLYLDTVGTVLVAIMLGPTAGAAVGLASQALLVFVFPPAVPFYLINMSVGFAAGVASRTGGFRTWRHAGASGLAIGFFSACVAIPLMALGLSHLPPDQVQDPNFLLRKVLGVFLGDLASEGSTSELLDKIVVCLGAYFLAGWIAKVIRLG